MKHKRDKASRSPVAGKSPAPTPSSSLAGGPERTRSRRWWFRVGLLLTPVVLLVLVELGLRLARYGYPTTFFLEAEHEGRPVLVDNPKFGWRFFPPRIARTPRPLVVAARKPPGTVRLVVFGESAAMGDPEPAYGFARQLERLLQARHPDKHIEVINAAMTAINSHVIREIARDCTRFEADFWLVYAGNNEVVGPFGAGTVFGRQAAGLGAVRLNLALKSTRLGQWIGRVAASSTQPTSWEGMELFLRQQVVRQDPRLQTVYANFAANLAAVVQLGRQSGARVLLTTVPVNLQDSPPFGSAHRARLMDAELAEWDKAFGRGLQAENAARWAEALTAYQQAARIDPEFAELIFRQAHCELEQQQSAVAQTDFARARDWDTLRFRADTRLNEIIRQTAAAQGLALVDAEQTCARHSTNGLAGAELFYDHVHLNFAGNYLLASLFAAACERAWPEPLSAANATLLSQTEMARQLAFTDFDSRRVGEEMRLRLQQPPFVGQCNFAQRDEQWRQTLAAPQTAPRELLPVYRQALALAPEDWILHANFARLLEAAQEEAAATDQWQAVARLIPHQPNAWFHLGRLAQSAGNHPEAERLLQEALKRKPEFPEALNQLGLVLAVQGQSQAALQQFERALQLQPGFHAARVNLAVQLAQAGEVPGAMAQYREVLRRDTNYIDARINLANLLAERGEAAQALPLYQEVLRQQPEEPRAHYNLGNALVAQGRPTEAIPHYEAVVRQQPGLATAQFELGLALARAGREAEALGPFAEAVRLKPDWAEAHFNYGIGLARAQRLAEAVEEFRATLQFQPAHPSAARALEQASRAFSVRSGELGVRNANRGTE